MNRVQVSPNFYLDEFIDPQIYASRGAKSIELIDHRIILAAQFIRDKTGNSVTINNWINGGQYRESGLRRMDTRTGAKFSQHKFGRAIDVKVAGMKPNQVFAILKANERYLIDNQIITTIENTDYTVSWLHVDCRFTGLDHLLIVNP